MGMLGAVVDLWAFALVQVGGADPAHLLAGATLVALLTVAACVLPRVLRPRTTHAAGVPVPTVREHTRRMPVPRHCDPDAAGHCRARAPSAHPLAA